MPHTHPHTPSGDSNALSPAHTAKYRQILYLALILNAAMFCLEIIAGKKADSSALIADSADFLADSLNYAFSLWALTQSSNARTKTARFKGWFMVVYGFALLAQAVWSLYHGSQPEAYTMAWVSALAFTTNLLVAWFFYAYRSGEANMRAVWMDARNDVLGNIAVLVAAGLVWFTATPWADLTVAFFMGSMAIASGWTIVRLAKAELAQSRHP
jgi:cation diffusion facilitator family transporter